MEVRESGLGATAHVPGRRRLAPGWEDAAVPPARLGAYLRDFRALLDRYGYHSALYGHFGQGCIHSRIDFDLRSREGIARFLAFLDEAADLVVAYGGSLSGEHGDGQARGELLPKMFGDELVGAFREFKRLWDPDGKMNPGKVVDPYPLDGEPPPRPRLPPAASRRPTSPSPTTAAASPPPPSAASASASAAAATAAPCARATWSRARRSTPPAGAPACCSRCCAARCSPAAGATEAVRRGARPLPRLQGCKSECPVNVDMATYKAEFLSHYYRAGCARAPPTRWG